VTRLCALALALVALCACGKYGPPVRPKPTPAHGAQSTPAPAAPEDLTPPEDLGPPPDSSTAAPATSDAEQCDDPNAAPVGARP